MEVGDVLGNMLPPGAQVWGVLWASLEVGVCDARVGGVGGLEEAPSGVFLIAAEVAVSVLCVLPAVTTAEVGSPTQVPLVNVGDDVTKVILSVVLSKTLVIISSDEVFTELFRVSLGTECRGCGGAT